MQSSSPAINLISYFLKQIKFIVNNLFSTLYITSLFFTWNNSVVYCQTPQTIPSEFQSLSTNARALEKTVNQTINSSTNQSTQNIPLDKTGFILHISTSPEIKDENIRIKVFSSDGEELELFPFKDGSSFFTLVNPDKTYSVSEEMRINCNELSSNFISTTNKIICPDTELFKIADNIVLSSDTSLKVMLITPSEFYLLPLTLASLNINQTNINLVQISNGEGITDNLPTNITIKDIFEKSSICLTGAVENPAPEPALDCNIINKNIKYQILYKDNLNGINTTETNNINLAFSTLAGFFNSLKNTASATVEEIFESTEPAEEISKGSKIPEPKFNNYNFNLKLSLGNIKKGKTRIKKNIFSLKTPLDLTKSLTKITYTLPSELIEKSINPFQKDESRAPLINLNINGTNKNSSSTFNIQADNNIILKSLIEPTPTPTPTAQTMTLISEAFQTSSNNSNIQIASYLPADSYQINVARNYSFIEETIAPSVNEKGKPIEIINNKSKCDLSFSTIFDKNIAGTTGENISLTFDKASDIFNKENSFGSPFLFSGFLIPPDFRPVLEDGYRATIELKRIFNIKQDSKNKITLSYKDIKTNDETPLTNFFKFSFVPEGEYKATIKFDSNREELFSKVGLIKKSK